MRSSAPFLKQVVTLLFLVSLLTTNTAYGQKRARAPQKSASRAAGLVEEADKLSEERKWPEAIDAYKLAIRLDANYAPAYGGLGDAYFNSGNSEQALVAYKEQARLAPNDAQAQFDLGYFYNAMGRYGEAFGPLTKASSLDPGFAEAFYGIGYAYLRGEDFEKSIGFLKNALRIKPDYGEAYYALGQAYARTSKTDLANEQVKKLNTIDAKQARRLEKEIQTISASANTVQTNLTATPAQTATQTSAPTQPSTEKPAARLVDTMQARPKQESATNKQSFAPQTSRQTPTQTSEPASRQLQQVPASQSQTTASQAGSSASQKNQITTLPVSAKRWALVIGVDKYLDPQISPLKGSDNDARMIADALVRFAGFPRDQVILLSTDQPIERQPTRVNILRRLSNLNTTVPKDGLLLVSFAGHGMERGGQAFLLPADAQISDQISFLEETAISTNRVKERIKETGVSQVLLLLDACRNDPGGRADAPNPLSNAYTNAFNFDVRNREVQAFATMYATGIGQRAYEYTEKKQGYFSWAVVEGLKGNAANEKGEVTLSQLVKYVQETVPKRLAIDLGSTKQQKPFAVIEGYRADELVLAVTNGASMASDNSTPNIATVDPAAIELSYWDTIKNSNNPEDFKSYLDKYPDGQFASLAKSRANGLRPGGNATGSESPEMLYWNAIKDSQTQSDFRAYITKFPQGLFVELANNRISSLEAKASGRSSAAAAGLTSGPVTLKDIEVSYKSNMYDETVRVASRFLETTPDSKEAHAYLGLALLAKKDADSAVLHLEKAIALGQSVNFPLKRLREPLLGHAFDDVIVWVTADSVIVQSGKTYYRANFSALKESRIGNYLNQCPIAFLKGTFSESSANSDKQGKPGEKGFNLFPATATLQQTRQGTLVYNVAACNDDGIVPTTIVKLIYRLSAGK